MISQGLVQGGLLWIQNLRESDGKLFPSHSQNHNNTGIKEKGSTMSRQYFLKVTLDWKCLQFLAQSDYNFHQKQSCIYVNLESDLWSNGSQSQGARTMISLVSVFLFFIIGWKTVLNWVQPFEKQPETLIYLDILVIAKGGKKKCI